MSISLLDYFQAFCMERINQDTNCTMVRDAMKVVSALVWNVRGAGSQEFLDVLKEHVRIH